jgi:hypothetical protein
LAGFGPTPASILGAPTYAWRVLRRRPALRKLYAARRDAHDGTKHECRERMSAILAGLREHWGAEPDLTPTFDALDRATDVEQERIQLLERARGERATQVGTVDQSLSALDRQREAVQTERRGAQAVVEGCADELARAQAQVKRADIELRALHDAAREAAGKGAKFAPPEHARRIAAAEQQRSELAGMVRERERALEQARGELRTKEAKLRELARQLASTQGQRHSLDRRGGQQEDLRSQALRAATEQRHEVAEQALRRLMQERHAAVEGAVREEVRTLDKRLRVSLEELERHRLAVDAFDPAALRRGLMLAGAAALLVLLLFVALVRVGGRPTPGKQPQRFPTSGSESR